MDLLRAVIVGADGTPYHDGLFFFDVYFTPSYPNTPPVCESDHESVCSFFVICHMSLMVVNFLVDCEVSCTWPPAQS